MLAMKAEIDERLQKIFLMMDTDGNGTIDAEEFTEFIRKVKNKQNHALLVRSARDDLSKPMSIDEFRSFFAELLRNQDYTEAGLESALQGIIDAHTAAANQADV